MKPTKYKNSKGEPRWMIQAYFGRDIHGKRIMKKRKGYKTQREAIIAYAQLLEERDNQSLSNKNMTVKELYDVWFPIYSKGLEPSTISKVTSYFKNHILSDTKRLKVSELTPPLLQTTLNNWALEAKSGVVWGRYFKKMITYAFFNDLIPSNPFDKVTTPKVINNSRERKIDVFLNSEQLHRFLKYWENKRIIQYAYFRLISYSGMRRGEILALEWSDIDFDKKTVSINKAIGLDYRNGTTKQYVKEPKANSGRKLHLDSTTLGVLKKYKQECEEDVLWPGIHKYMDFNVPERWLQKFKNDPEVDDDLKNVTLHGLRHTHATVIFEQAAINGKAAPLKAVQKRMGHATIEMTLNIYTHVTDNENNLVDELIEKGFS
ncbi:Integrase/recombinase [Fructobacillus tropaeoli]|uniref:tyrosine-type recombinase/integrase n=1 Tax=Fructobacillus tropaeoli TaxID=709323 RepID=UPI002D81E29E|nr:Integrase/recombinase [Fructobacillus tropaeoli]